MVKKGWFQSDEKKETYKTKIKEKKYSWMEASSTQLGYFFISYLCNANLLSVRVY